MKTKQKHESVFDAIIVLGAQVKPDGTPSVQLAWRLDLAITAYQKHPVPIVVCGAMGGDEPSPESEIMKKYLADHGIPPDHIMEDSHSYNTYENIENAAKILSDTADFRRVLIVTSDYHIPRALAIARDCGLNPIGAGSPCLPKYWIKNHFRESLAWGKYILKKYIHIPL